MAKSLSTVVFSMVSRAHWLINVGLRIRSGSSRALKCGSLRSLILMAATLLQPLILTPVAANELNVGTANATQTEVQIPLVAPMDINYKTRSELLNWRAKFVSQYPQLLVGQYEPSEEVFGQIVDGKPWWGIRGEALHGEGEHSIEGPAEESRFLMNPFLLVAANPYVMEIWDKERTTEDDMNRSEFPFTWLPKTLRWWPSKSMVEVIYPVTEYNALLYKFRDKLIDQKIDTRFALVAYNARDFGYHWIFLNQDASTKIECLQKPTEPIRIDQFIHCGGSCGYPGGCNNMSPSIPKIDENKYTELPARAYVSLWKQKPSSARQPADMTVVLTLE